jgi:nicotinate-nucleotide pyrophosphorylase (carboxylating)
MTNRFAEVRWDDVLADDCRRLVHLAVREDLDRGHDWTTVALVEDQARGQAAIVAREEGVVAGLRAVQLALEVYDPQAYCTLRAADGQAVVRGETLATLDGSARSLLTSERVLLNLLGRLSGVATLARRYVDAVAGTGATVYDTRKTTPGWRRLEKYAVRCGGAANHRTGLFDAVLIKDNHLALGQTAGSAGFSPAEAVRRVRAFLQSMTDIRQRPPAVLGNSGRNGAVAAAVDAPDPLGRIEPDYRVPEPVDSAMVIEVEVDSLDALRDVLGVAPDIVLLDNMDLAQLREAVAIRDASAPDVVLEASGGVRLDTIRSISETGVDRISVGALTHSAVGLDVAMDWTA